tara:strand:- start:769 stop:1062 length:294 start_codon:yes stop_codon:yes gene_type:complete
MAIRAGKFKTIVNEVAKFNKEEIEFLFELMKNSMIPGEYIGTATEIVNKLKSQYQLLQRKDNAVVKETKTTESVEKEELEKDFQNLKEENGELWIEE